jgi:hypothetical protein
MRIRRNKFSGFLEFCCPGCGLTHRIDTIDFNEDYNFPTISSSIIVKYYVKGQENLCHYSIKDGSIQFFPDSSHALSGITVNLYEIINGFANSSSGM